MNEQAPSPIQSAIRPGIIIGLVSLVITYIAYFIDSSYLASGYFGLIALVLFFGLIIFSEKNFEKSLADFLHLAQPSTLVFCDFDFWSYWTNWQHSFVPCD